MEGLSRETILRMDGLCSMKAQENLIDSVRQIKVDLFVEGFEEEEIEQYIIHHIKMILKVS